MLGELMTKIGPSSPIGRDVAKAIYDLGKHVPPGAVAPTGQMNQLEALRHRILAQGPQMAALKGMQPGGGGLNGLPPPSGGAPPIPGAGPMPGAGPGAGPPMPPPG
jgi:hypothetical protein